MSEGFDCLVQSTSDILDSGNIASARPLSSLIMRGRFLIALF
jgi:hypothetical protein